jgi:hypothetical protein
MSINGLKKKMSALLKEIPIDSGMYKAHVLIFKTIENCGGSKQKVIRELRSYVNAGVGSGYTNPRTYVYQNALYDLEH